MIEEDKKPDRLRTILVAVFHAGSIGSGISDAVGIAQEQICQLFEPRPNEGRLLTQDLYWQIMAILQGMKQKQDADTTITWRTNLDDAIDKLKDAKTASILKAQFQEKIAELNQSLDYMVEAYDTAIEVLTNESQERVERIKREIERVGLEPDGHIKIYPSKWQALKEQELK